MVVLRRSRGDRPTSDFGGTKLSLLLEKQHNRGQDGAGAAILRARPVPGEEPYWLAKSASATPLVDVLGAIARREGLLTGLTASTRFKDSDNPVNLVDPVKNNSERMFLGHLRVVELFGPFKSKLHSRYLPSPANHTDQDTIFA